MSKAILVFDMPESCGECDIMFPDEYSDWCGWCRGEEVYDHVKNDTKPDWCPLRKMPEKRKINIVLDHDVDLDCSIGYNGCIDEILSMFEDTQEEKNEMDCKKA